MNELFEIIKIVLPAGIVFLTSYYMLQKFFDQDNHKRLFEAKLSNKETITPIRLQAFERVVLFLERINPNSIVIRANKVGTANNLEKELMQIIRSEFEHNLSQQVYISNASWEATVKAKEEIIKIIQVAASKTGKDATAMDLAQAILNISSQLNPLPTKIAIDSIKKEIRKEF